MSPNLEQTGLLRSSTSRSTTSAKQLTYGRAATGRSSAPAPETRASIARVLLDYLRRELAIKVDYLQQDFQEQLTQVSNQRLRSPWALDENEKFEYARSRSRGLAGKTTTVDGPTSRRAAASGSTCVGRRPSRPTADAQADGDGADHSPASRSLAGRGPRGTREEPESKEDVPGYQVPASAMRWVAGDGTAVVHDPIRVPAPTGGRRRPNQFFLDFYRNVAADGQGLEAREHTAQVPYARTGGARGAIPDGEAADPVLLADDGARRRHRQPERRQHAQRPADAGELRAAQRPRRPQRPARARLHLLLGRQPARPVLLPPADS